VRTDSTQCRSEQAHSTFLKQFTRTQPACEPCRYINGMTLDDRPVRADFDWGFKEGRQFGRGRSGGQVC